jgi:hypothetical protein
MHDRVPWTGGISNREIVIDSLRGLTVWAAVSFSLLALAWWITGYIHFPSPHWRMPVCVALGVVIGGPMARWCRGDLHQD